MLLATGQTLNGRYKITQELAQGGFGATFLAADLHLPEHPLCVVKQLKPQTSDPTSLKTARRLFETEAQILHELGKQDQIPQLLAYFEEAQEFYLVEDYIEGDSLREEFTKKGAQKADDVVALLKEILNILVFVHHNQVIHRDHNPSNLIRRATDQKLCLIDFGAVKRVTTQFKQSSGQATVAIGTQGYIPSEQAQGRPQFGSDLYAAGMIAIEALTGQFPHNLATDPHTAEILWRDSAEVGDELAAILDKLIRHDFRERYFSAQIALEALDELNKATTTNTVVLRPPTAATITPQANNSPAVVSSTLQTQMPLAAGPRVYAKDKTAIAVVSGLGLAALVSIGFSINLGWQWLASRQETNQQFEQAQLHQELNETDDAIASYQDVLDENSRHQGALLGKAQVLQQVQRYDEALTTYDQLLQINPNSWEAWWGKGKIFSDRQQYPEAIAALDRAIQGNGRSVEIWQTKAQIHLEQNDTDNAFSSLDSLLNIDGRQAWAWYEKGWIHHNRQEYRDAINAYDRALRINNTDSNIWYQKGNSYFKLEEYKEAANSYARVVRLKPDHAPAWYSQGIAFENLKKYDDAQLAFTKVVALEPNNDRAWYHVAWNAQQNGEIDNAIAAYQRTVSLKGNDYSSWLNLANLLYQTKNYPRALTAYDQALSGNSDNGDAWENKGNSHLVLGQYPEAIAAYDRALQYKPNDEEILQSREEAQAQIEWQQTQQDIKDDLKEKAEDLKEGIEDLIPWQ